VCLHKFMKLVTSSVIVRRFYIEQVFVLVRIQFHNHAYTQPVKRFWKAMRYIYDIKFGTLQVRKNEISLRKCSGDFAQLCALEGTLVIRESARFDKNDTEPKFKLGYVPRRKSKFFKTHIVESILWFSQCQIENECFSRGGNCRPQNGRILK